MSPPMVAWSFPTDHAAVAGCIVAGALLIVCAAALLRRRTARAFAPQGDSTGGHQLDDPGPLDHRPLDHRPLDHRPLDHRPLDHRPLDHRPLDHRPLDHRPLDDGAARRPASVAIPPTAGAAAVPEPAETPPPTITAATPTTTFVDRTAPAAVHPSAAIPPPAERRTVGAPGTVRTAGNGSRTTRFERGGRNRPGVASHAVGPAATRS